MLSLLPPLLLTTSFSFNPVMTGYELPSLSSMEDAPLVAVKEEPVPGFGQLDKISRGTRITFTTQYAHLFTSDVDSNQGEFTLDRVRLNLKGRTKITESWALSYGFKYQFDGYDFSGPGFFGDAKPWTDIHTVVFDVGAIVKLTDQWRGFFGGQFRFARETDARWSDGFEGGGAFGASYSFNADLTLGAGLGIESQLEDSLLYYPIVVVDWRINDQWSVNTRITSGWGDTAGVQLIYDWTDSIQLALGANYDYQRFRLNDESPTPDGVGHFTAMPVYVRLTWLPRPNIELTAFVGVNISGKLESKNSQGNTVAKHDYGLGAMVGGQFSVTF
jgi:hypothetical protein